jgi:LEA14-like dessication related protein
LRRLAVVAAFLMLVGGAGCRSLGRYVFEEPRVTFKDVQINGLGLSGGSLDILLNVYNPNSYRLDATRLTYKLLVDSVEFGTGATDSEFIVQEKDSAVVRLPLTFTWAGLGSVGRELLTRGTVEYQVVGDVTVGSPLGAHTIPYDQTGQFSTLRGASRDRGTTNRE